jgi:hypothetical protein
MDTCDVSHAEIIHFLPEHYHICIHMQR